MVEMTKEEKAITEIVDQLEEIVRLWSGKTI